MHSTASELLRNAEKHHFTYLLSQQLTVYCNSSYKHRKTVGTKTCRIKSAFNKISRITLHFAFYNPESHSNPGRAPKLSNIRGGRFSREQLATPRKWKSEFVLSTGLSPGKFYGVHISCDLRLFSGCNAIFPTLMRGRHGIRLYVNRDLAPTGIQIMF